MTEEYRREELMSAIERAVKNMTLQELEALYYDMSTKNYINSPLPTSPRGGEDLVV